MSSTFAAHQGKAWIATAGRTDAHSIVLTGLRTAFAEQENFYVVGSATDAAGALALTSAQELDVMVLDVHFGQSSAVDTISQISVIAPETKIVIFSGYPQEQYATFLYRLGARAFVDKAAPIEDLLAAIRTVTAGDTAFSAKTQSKKISN